MRIVGMIPVRMESSRLPNKPIKDICGLPMIIHTLKRVQLCQTLDDVFVATDNIELKKLVESYGGKVIMTKKEHKTGSDRLAEAALKVDADIIVNIQGDEALVNPDHIDKGIEGLINSDAEISILLTKYDKKHSSSDIKAVVNLKNEIMYLSRTDLPSDLRSPVEHMLKAYHIVSFKKNFLLTYATLEQTPLEKIEFNEYLRVLENGYKIQGVLVESDAISVDTVDDLEKVRELMAGDIWYPKYI
jgi:3-deoxy-manno-octulosonate cytidylyltransferase (CMP-KDO synthetase)